MKTVNNWLTRKVTHPIKATIRGCTGYIIDEISVSSDGLKDEVFSLRKEVRQLSNSIEDFAKANRCLMDEVVELTDSLRDNRNETAIRESGVMASLDDSGYDELDLEIRFDGINETIEQFHLAMESVPDLIQGAIDDIDREEFVGDILDELVISFR